MVPEDRPTFQELYLNISSFIESMAGYLQVGYNPFTVGGRKRDGDEAEKEEGEEEVEDKWKEHEEKDKEQEAEVEDKGNEGKECGTEKEEDIESMSTV